MPSLKKKDAIPGTGKTASVTLPTESEWRERADRVIHILNEWAAEGPEYDNETWPLLKKALGENHPTSRKLFDGE